VDDFDSKFKLAFAAVVVLQLSLLGFGAWVVVKLLQHFGVI
jgi:hypothetical protein